MFLATSPSQPSTFTSPATPRPNCHQPVNQYPATTATISKSLAANIMPNRTPPNSAPIHRHKSHSRRSHSPPLTCIPVDPSLPGDIWALCASCVESGAGTLMASRLLRIRRYLRATERLYELQCDDTENAPPPLHRISDGGKWREACDLLGIKRGDGQGESVDYDDMLARTLPKAKSIVFDRSIGCLGCDLPPYLEYTEVPVSVGRKLWGEDEEDGTGAEREAEGKARIEGKGKRKAIARSEGIEILIDEVVEYAKKARFSPL